MKLKFNYLFLLLAVVIPFAFTNCGKDDDDNTGGGEETPKELALSSYSVTVNANGATTTVSITDGNGGYSATVNTAGSAFATATIADKTITITGKAAGTAIVTVSDAKNKTKEITVTVNPVAELLSLEGWDVTAPISGSNPNRDVKNILNENDDKEWWEPLGGPYTDLATNPRVALVDMKTIKTINEIVIGRRTDNILGTTDTRKVAIYLATEADKYPETPVETLDFGDITNIDAKKSIKFTATSAQFIKLAIIESNPRVDGGSIYANIASIQVFGW